MQLKLNRMRQYQMLVNRNQDKGEEGVQLFYTLEGSIAYQAIAEHEDKLDIMRGKLNNERSQKWRGWIEHSWGHKKKDIYKCIRGKKGNGPLIVSNGGSAQIKYILKLGEETWGGPVGCRGRGPAGIQQTTHASGYRR
eukprot:6572078-Heterocapsa_arctica.AAC.1